MTRRTSSVAATTWEESAVGEVDFLYRWARGKETGHCVRDYNRVVLNLRLAESLPAFLESPYNREREANDLGLFPDRRFRRSI